MSAKKLLGIDITATALRIAVYEGRGVSRFLEERVPDNMVREGQIVSWDAMADYIKETLKERGVRIRDAAITVPEAAVYIQHAVLPLMTTEQLRVNLPYEFHDYITRDMDSYIYDYAVNSLTEERMDLLAVAAPKDLVDRYMNMSRRAGLRLRILAPDVLAFRNILKDYNARTEAEGPGKDYAILDLGDQATQIHFFTGGEFEVTRTLDVGCSAIAQLISETTGLDPHLILMGQAGELIRDAANSEAVADQCNGLALQVMRALNFYSYNNPNNTMEALYVCGFGRRLELLMQELGTNVDLPLKPLTELFGVEDGLPDGLEIAPQAYGIAIGKEG